MGAFVSNREGRKRADELMPYSKKDWARTTLAIRPYERGLAEKAAKELGVTLNLFLRRALWLQLVSVRRRARRTCKREGTPPIAGVPSRVPSFMREAEARASRPKR